MYGGFRESQASAARHIHYDLAWKQPLAIGIGAVFAAATAFFLLYTFRGAPSEHSLMNTEGILALAFLAIICLRAERKGTQSTWLANRAVPFWPALVFGLLAVVIVLAFAGAIRTPLLYDDYGHITEASLNSWHSAWRQFGRVIHPPGLFFRPLGFLLYWLNYLWAGISPARWHATSVILHVATTCLACALFRQAGLARPTALAAALLFALQGAAAETVGWIDARFDLMATPLVLSSLLLVCRHASTCRPGWLAAALATGSAAMLTKETAFCLPLLIGCLAFFRGAGERRRIWVASAWAAAFTAVLFAYRWWALGGIGGYRSPAGAPNIAQFSVLRVLNGLFLREWAILFFPFDWALPAGPLLRIALATVPVILAVCAFTAKATARRLAGCLIFAIAASLPVQHLLTMGSGLGGTRNLYLVSVGWAMLWGVLLESMNWKIAGAVASVLLVVQVLMLEHNLQAWRAAANLAQSVCTQFGQAAAREPGVVVVRGLPDTHDGAVFLHNGFPQCVEMNSGFPASRILLREPWDPHPAWAAKEYVWNDAHQRFEESAH